MLARNQNNVSCGLGAGVITIKLSGLSTGVRKWNITHTILCYNYSVLNYDLFRFNSKNNPGCACGFECENVFHFFLECPINEHIRNIIFVMLQIYGAIDIDIILYGNENLTEAQNVDILTAVQTFIHNSHRFKPFDILLQVLLSLVLFPLFLYNLFCLFCERLISLIHCSNIYFIGFCLVLCYNVHWREKEFIMLL